MDGNSNEQAPLNTFCLEIVSCTDSAASCFALGRLPNFQDQKLIPASQCNSLLFVHTVIKTLMLAELTRCSSSQPEIFPAFLQHGSTFSTASCISHVGDENVTVGQTVNYTKMSLVALPEDIHWLNHLEEAHMHTDKSPG